MLTLIAGSLAGCTVPGPGGECVPGTLCLGLQHVEDTGGPPSPDSALLANPGFVDPRGTWWIDVGDEIRFERLRGERVEGAGQFWYHQGNNFWSSADGDLHVQFETQRTGLIWGENETQPAHMELVSR